MFLYTTVPAELIMQQPDSMEYQYRQAHNSFIQGVEMNGNFTISRLISTNPRMFLDPRFAPGCQLPKK